MTAPPSGAIDCDIHIAVPGTKALLPFLDDHWREHVVLRGIDDLELMYTMNRSPFACRSDWRPPSGKPGSDFDMVRTQALDAFGSRFGILNCLWGAPALHADDLALVLCRATNEWIAKEWLDRDPRLRASILVPMGNPELAAEEIERCAADKRFVQVLMLAMGETPLGKRQHWPIYRAAEKHKLAIGIHAGSSYRHSPTMIGWPSYYIEDYVSQSAGFQSQLLSLVSEGVFTKFPELRVILIESGVTWLPGFLWRADKTWRGLRMEVPWLKEAPSDIVRRNVRMTIQPMNAPDDPELLGRIMEHIGSEDMLLFSTDYPHWQFDGNDALPDGLPEGLLKKIMFDNPLDAYPRLKETLQ